MSNVLRQGHRLGPLRPCMDGIIWFLTGNEGKLREARHHFSALGYEVKPLVVPEGSVVEPQAGTLEAVAFAKIEQAKLHLPHANAIVLVEDAGLFVDALNGFPGVYSAYAMDTIGPNGILRLMQHLTTEDIVQVKKLRSAAFQAVAVLWDGEQCWVGRGECKGSIAMDVRGEEGFGFDPVFIPYDLDEFGDAMTPDRLGTVSTHGQTFGEVDAATKHAFSHRRRALDALVKAWGVPDARG